MRWVFRPSHTDASGSRESQKEKVEFQVISSCKKPLILFPHFFFFINMNSLVEETRSRKKPADYPLIPTAYQTLDPKLKG